MIISEVILRDASGSVVSVVCVDATLPADGALVAVVANFPTMTASVTYIVSLVSKLGNQFVSPAFRPTST